MPLAIPNSDMVKSAWRLCFGQLEPAAFPKRCGAWGTNHRLILAPARVMRFALCELQPTPEISASRLDATEGLAFGSFRTF